MRRVRLSRLVSIAALAGLAAGLAACSSPSPTPTLAPTATPTATPAPIPTDTPTQAPTIAPTFTPTPDSSNAIRPEPTATHTPESTPILDRVIAVACDSDDFHAVVKHVYAQRNVQEGLDPFYTVAAELGYSKDEIETLTRDWCRENLNPQVFCEETDIQNIAEYLFLTFKDAVEWEILDNAHQTVTNSGLFNVGFALAEGLLRTECKRMLAS